MISEKEEDFLIEDAETILVGMPYHWRDWIIVLQKENLLLWSDAVVLVLPKFSYGWFYFYLDRKIAALNPDGNPVKPIDIPLRQILEYLRGIHQSQMETGYLSEPILSAPGATRLVIGEWSLFCNKEGEISVQNSITDTAEIMLKEDLRGFIFQTTEGEKKSFIAENCLDLEFAADWAVKNEKRFISKSKLEDLKEKEKDCLKEDAVEILDGKPYHWCDWSIVLHKDVLYLWSDAVVLGLAKFSYGWFCFILDGKLAAMNPDGIPVNPNHIHVTEIQEKLQAIHQSQMEAGPPSEPIFSAPDTTLMVVGKWSLLCNKEGEISVQNTITDTVEIMLKEDLPGFIFKTNEGEKKSFVAENCLGPEFPAGWAVKNEKRFIAKSKLEDLKEKEEDVLIEDAEKILVGKPYHWRDWTIVLDDDILRVWSDAFVLGLEKFSYGYFYFIHDRKQSFMKYGIPVIQAHAPVKEILEKLRAIHQSQMETGTPSQPILSAPGATRLVVGEWSLFCNKEGEMRIQNSMTDKETIILKEDLPGFIFETDKGERKAFTAENSLRPEFAAGWTVKKGKRFIAKSKLEDLKRKEEDIFKKYAKELLIGKPYHWRDWSIVRDEDGLYLWSEAVVLGLDECSFGWFHFILDGKLAAMNPDGIPVNISDVHVRQILEKLLMIHQSHIETGPPSQPILSSPGATRFIVGEWSLFCNKEGEISAESYIAGKETITLKEDLPGFIFETDVGEKKPFIAENSLGPEFAGGWGIKKEKFFIAKQKLGDLKKKEEDFLIEDAKEILVGKPYHWRDWNIVLAEYYLYLWSDAAFLRLFTYSNGWFHCILDGKTLNISRYGIRGEETDVYLGEILEKLQANRQSQMEAGLSSQPILSAPSATRLVVGEWSLFCKRNGEIRVHNSFLYVGAIVLKEDLRGFIYQSNIGTKYSLTAQMSLDREFAAAWAVKREKGFITKSKLEDTMQKEEDFLIEDSKQILLGKSYHWGDWSIVLVEDYLYLWSDEVVLVLPKFSYVWLCFILDGKLAIMNSDGIPENQTDEYRRGILEKLQAISQSQMKMVVPSQPILSSTRATSLVVHEWSLFCNSDGEITIHNSFNTEQAIMLKEDLAGFIFVSDIGTKHLFTAETSLGSEFKICWTTNEEKRSNSKSKLEPLKQQGEDLLLEDAKEILLGKPYHWRDWNIVLDEEYFFLWSDAAVLQLSKGNIGWFRFILDGEIALMYPDGTPGSELDEYRREIQEKLQEVRQSQKETGPPSQPILSVPGSTPVVVGPWSLFCKRDGELRVHNSSLSQEAIVLKEDYPGFTFETDIGKKIPFTAKKSLGPEFSAGWAKKKEKSLNPKSKLKELKRKEEEFLIEDAKEILLGKPYHWRDWSIVLHKGYLYLWSYAAVLQLSDGSAGWFRFILDGKIKEMFPDAILKNETDERRREILKHLQSVRQNKLETGSPSQPILSAPGSRRLVFGTWSLFCNRDEEISVHHSIFSKQRIILKEGLPGFIFESDTGEKRLFTAESSLGPEFPAGWAKKREKQFNPKSKLKDLTQKEEDLLVKDAKEILPGKPYHWRDWSIVLDDIYLYLWNDAAVLDLCKESGGWFRFILDGDIAVMHSRGIIVDVPDECRRETLEKLKAVHRNQVKSGPPSQPILTVPGATRLVVGNWSLFCTTDGEISVRHCIYCKHAITLKEDMPGFIFESSIGKTFSFTAEDSLHPEFASGWAGKKEKLFIPKSKSEDLKQKEKDLLLEDAKEIVLGKPYHWRDWSIVLDEQYFFLWSDATVLQLSKGNIGWFRFILDGEIALMYPDGTPGNELDEYRREIQENLQVIRHSQMETGPPSQPILSTPGSTTLKVGPWSLFCKRDGEIRVHNSFLSQEAIVLKEDFPGFIFETDVGERKSFTAKKSLKPEFVAGWAKKKEKRFNPISELKDLKQKENFTEPRVGKCSFCKTTLNENILLFHEKECVYRQDNFQIFKDNYFKMVTTVGNHLKKIMKFSK